MGGWVDGWVGGWVGGKAGLRIAYSNQQTHQPLPSPTNSFTDFIIFDKLSMQLFISIKTKFRNIFFSKTRWRKNPELNRMRTRRSPDWSRIWKTSCQLFQDFSEKIYPDFPPTHQQSKINFEGFFRALPKGGRGIYPGPSYERGLGGIGLVRNLRWWKQCMHITKVNGRNQIWPTKISG